MKNLIVALIAALSLTACLPVSADTAREALEDEGFHDVEMGALAPFSCANGDTFRSHWTARRTIVRPDGTTTEREVEGTICCGWFKDCTIRH